MKPTLLILAAAFSAITLALAFFIEVLACYPLPLWYYGVVTIVVAVSVLVVRNKRFAWAGVAYFLLLLCLYLVPWSPRKTFLQALDRIKAGMTVEEVRAIMSGYSEGTGWPANPFEANRKDGLLQEVSSGRSFPTSSNEHGELVIPDSIVFRHSTNDGRFNSDWGVVEFRSNRVVRVSFLPD